MNQLLIILILASIWLISKIAFNVDEVTIEQRERNPELNTKDFDLHEIRLKKYSKSKYKNRIFYTGKDGSCYYYSATGNKFYC